MASPTTKILPEIGTELFGGSIFLDNYFDSSRKNGKEIWKLKCTCGSEFERRANDTRYAQKIKRRTLCNVCCRKGNSALPNLKGGDLVAGCEFIEQFLKDVDRGQTFWKLKCQCGFVFNRRASEHYYFHKKGKKKLCKNTHLHRDITIGQRFNRLTIIDFVKKEERERLDKKGKPYIEKRTYAICVCSCDNKKIEVLPEQLRKGDVQSCGCYQKESVGNRFRTHGKTNTKEFELWYSAKERAVKSGLPFDIELEDIVIPTSCPVLGIPIHTHGTDGIRNQNSPSLDKFYPEKGYVKGNIQVISWRANRIKSDGSPDEWIKIAKWCQQEDIKNKLKG